MKSFKNNGLNIIVSSDERSDGVFLGKLEDGTLVFRLEHFNFKFSQVVLITHFEVKEDFRRKKIGLKILKKFEEWAKRKGFKIIEGNIPNDNNREYSPPKTLAKFYKKAKYRIFNINLDRGQYARFNKILS